MCSHFFKILFLISLYFFDFDLCKFFLIPVTLYFSIVCPFKIYFFILINLYFKRLKLKYYKFTETTNK